MMKNNKMVIALIVLLVILGGVLAFFFIRDRKMAVIERKTGIDIPSYCDLKEYVAYGSLFNRTGFEAKFQIDSADHINELIVMMNQKLGDDYHEIELKDYNVEKYSLFSGQKLVPNPSATSWVIVGYCKSGTLVVFMDIENDSELDMYMYYNE